MSMTTATIAIRDKFVSDGTTKQGRPYTLVKLYSTKRDYYETFLANMPRLSEIEQGSEVDVEFSDAGKEHHYKLIKILAVRNRQTVAEKGTADASQSASGDPQAAREGGQGGSGKRDPTPSPPLSVGREVATNFAEGIKTVMVQFDTDLSHIKQSPALIEAVVEAAHQYQSYKMAERIQADKERNMRSIR